MEFELTPEEYYSHKKAAAVVKAAQIYTDQIVKCEKVKYKEEEIGGYWNFLTIYAYKAVIGWSVLAGLALGILVWIVSLIFGFSQISQNFYTAALIPYFGFVVFPMLAATRPVFLGILGFILYPILHPIYNNFWRSNDEKMSKLIAERDACAAAEMEKSKAEIDKYRENYAEAVAHQADIIQKTPVIEEIVNSVKESFISEIKVTKRKNTIKEITVNLAFCVFDKGIFRIRPGYSSTCYEIFNFSDFRLDPLENQLSRYALAELLGRRVKCDIENMDFGDINVQISYKMSVIEAEVAQNKGINLEFIYSAKNSQYVESSGWGAPPRETSIKSLD